MPVPRRSIDDYQRELIDLEEMTAGYLEQLRLLQNRRVILNMELFWLLMAVFLVGVLIGFVITRIV